MSTFANSGIAVNSPNFHEALKTLTRLFRLTPRFLLVFDLRICMVVVIDYTSPLPVSPLLSVDRIRA